jgi:hypothetical protein
MAKKKKNKITSFCDKDNKSKKSEEFPKTTGLYAVTIVTERKVLVYGSPDEITNDYVGDENEFFYDEFDVSHDTSTVKKIVKITKADQINNDESFENVSDDTPIHVTHNGESKIRAFNDGLDIDNSDEYIAYDDMSLFEAVSVEKIC